MKSSEDVRILKPFGWKGADFKQCSAVLDQYPKSFQCLTEAAGEFQADETIFQLQFLKEMGVETFLLLQIQCHPMGTLCVKNHSEKLVSTPLHIMCFEFITKHRPEVTVTSHSPILPPPQG